ncbi:MAG: sulfurtransferase TusA family protein [Magnetococcus sp. WYHC-3]
MQELRPFMTAARSPGGGFGGEKCVGVEKKIATLPNERHTVSQFQPLDPPTLSTARCQAPVAGGASGSLIIDLATIGGSIVMADQTLDAKGLNCPLPILRAKKALKAMEAGQVLAVEATDPGSAKDFESFCNQTGNQLISASEKGGVYSFEIRKS